MDDASRALKPWVTFAGCVLIIVILHWAQALLVPIATHDWLIDPRSAACSRIQWPTVTTNIVVNTRPSVTISIEVFLPIRSQRADDPSREPEQS